MIFAKECFLILITILPEILLSNNCTNIPPFFHRLRDGVDITKLDLLPLDLTTNDGFRYPVLSFTCDFETKQEINGILYDIPDQVWSVVNVPSGWLNSNVNIYKTSHSVKKSMSANADVGFNAGFFSASASYESMQGFLTNSSKYLEEVTSFTSGYNVNMMPDWMLQMGREAKLFIERFLPPYLDEKSIHIYNKFIKTFGTHFFNHGKFGGLLRVLLATNQNYFQSTSDSTVRAQASATFFGLINLGGGFSSTTQQVDSKFSEATTKIIRYYGGRTNLLADGGIAAWEPTVSANPWLLGGRFTEMSEIITDESKKKSMKRAIQIYTDMGYLHELLRITEWNLNNGKFYKHKNTLHSYKRQAQNLLLQSMPEHNKIIELGRLAEAPFDVPYWFKNAKACFFSSNESNATICPFFKNATCGVHYPFFTERICKIHWRLKIWDYEDWFKDVKLCYKWWPRKDNASCVESSAPTVSCSGINMDESFYKDDTFSHLGLCRIQWMLFVPSNAPLWMTDVQLCVYVGTYMWQTQCAVVNSYTSMNMPNCERKYLRCYLYWRLEYKNY